MCQYSKKITFKFHQWSGVVPHGGMTEAQGNPSFGKPIPPLATRQKIKVSCNWAIVPGSGEIPQESG